MGSLIFTKQGGRCKLSITHINKIISIVVSATKKIKENIIMTGKVREVGYFMEKLRDR